MLQKYRRLAEHIQNIYLQSSETFNNFQKDSGLTCLNGCGKCCLNPEASATVIEMLPLALHLFDEGTADTIYEKLNSKLPHCLFYTYHSPDGEKGQCSAYNYRPSICRSFGASSRITKHGGKEWAFCKYIKENKSHLIERIDIENAPIITQFATQIFALDPAYGSKLLPINETLKIILEKLLLEQNYLEIRG